MSNPTVSHDTLHGFLPAHPHALDRALEIIGLGISPGVTAVPLPADASGAPKMFTRAMDTVFRVMRPEGAKPFILLVEAQTERDDLKETSWPYYVAYLRDKYKLEVVLLVLCTDATTAKWAAQPLSTGIGRATQTTVPHVLCPDNVPRITTRQEAARDLDFAAFSVWIHSKDADIEGILTSVGEALAEKADSESRNLAGQIEDGLGTEFAREIWRHLMSSLFTPIRGTIVGDAQIAGLEEGCVKKEAENLLHLLERRGLPVTQETRERVTSCTDLPTLDLWFDRAIDAATTEAVFAELSPTGRVPAPAQSPDQADVPASAD